MNEADFVHVPVSSELLFCIIDDNGKRRYYRIAAFDLNPLREVLKPKPCKTPRTLRVFEVFSVDGCVHTDFDSGQQSRNVPSPENVRRLERDMGLFEGF